MTEVADMIGTDGLPPTLPIFPLAGVLLLPGGRLPLNIFEPRYLAMVRDAMAGQRLIGMVQPTDPGSRASKPEVYKVGCAGRIVQFNETDDGRILIVLGGISRFRIAEELSAATLYRQVRADWSPYANDTAEDKPAEIDRPRLLRALRAFLSLHNIPAEWQAIEKAPSDALVTSLAMICPFAPNEKQALLEAGDATECCRVMVALMEMALLNRVAPQGDERGRPLN